MENIRMEKKIENAKNMILMVIYFLMVNIYMEKNGMENYMI